MLSAFPVLLILIVGYFLGSINSALVVGKFYNIDIRQHGSRNAGTTNVLRTLGKKAAVLVIIGDLLKGILACTVARLLVGASAASSAIAIAGLATVMGHNWPVYFHFKGGKGVLTTFAIAMMMDWKVSIFLFILFIIIVLMFKYVSLGSIICSLLFPIIFILGSKDGVSITCSILLALLVLIRHIGNLRRIIDGTEHKLGYKTAK